MMLLGVQKDLESQKDQTAKALQELRVQKEQVTILMLQTFYLENLSDVFTHTTHFRGNLLFFKLKFLIVEIIFCIKDNLSKRTSLFFLLLI